jgi:hypothetical protein
MLAREMSAPAVTPRDELVGRNGPERKSMSRRDVVEHLDDGRPHLDERALRHGHAGHGDVVAGIDLDGVGGERLGWRSSGRHI